MTPSTLDMRIVQKQATPEPVTTAVGTGSSSTRTEFTITIHPEQAQAQVAESPALARLQPATR